MVKIMYEDYSNQALPSRDYRESLGSALCVFNANNSFVIENIINDKEYDTFNWHQLIDKESGQLKSEIEKTIPKEYDNNIATLFSEVVEMRNRIIHSFQITDKSGEQVLATKNKIKKGNEQFVITQEYLLDFIKKNEILSNALHEFREF